MPLFFFLSGLFLFRSTTKPWLEVASDKLRTIAYPYFVWSVITLLVKAALGSATNYPYDLSDFPLIFYQPIDQFWFLYALFLLLMVASAGLKLGFPPWVIFVAAVLLYPGLLPVSSFGLGILHMTRLMALYFGLGVFIGSEQNIRAISGAPVRWLPLGVAAGLLVSSFAGWSELPYRHAFLPTSMFAVSGIAAVVALALLADRAKLGAAIRFLGRHSLEIYVVHTMAMAGVRITLAQIRPHISPGAASRARHGGWPLHSDSCGRTVRTGRLPIRVYAPEEAKAQPGKSIQLEDRRGSESVSKIVLLAAPAASTSSRRMICVSPWTPSLRSPPESTFRPPTALQPCRTRRQFDWSWVKEQGRLTEMTKNV